MKVEIFINGEYRRLRELYERALVDYKLALRNTYHEDIERTGYFYLERIYSDVIYRSLNILRGYEARLKVFKNFLKQLLGQELEDLSEFNDVVITCDILAQDDKGVPTKPALSVFCNNIPCSLNMSLGEYHDRYFMACMEFISKNFGNNPDDLIVACKSVLEEMEKGIEVGNPTRS